MFCMTIHKTILLTGGTGFVGTEFLNQYKDTYNIYALYRTKPGVHHPTITWIQGDLLDPSYLKKIDKKPHAIVHIGGSSPNRAYADGHFKATTTGTQHLITYAKKIKIAHFLFISSLSVLVKNAGPYVASKLKAEEMIKHSPLPYTILRPTVILGNGARDFTRIIRMIKQYPIFPLIHNGSNIMKPISSPDLAHIIHKTLFSKNMIKKTMPVVGKYALTQKELLQKAAKMQNASPFFIPLPLSLALPIAHIAEKIHPRLGLNRERLLLQSHSIEDIPHCANKWLKDHKYQTVEEMIVL